MEKLFKKLKELGYTDQLGRQSANNSAAHEIIEYYQEHGSLDGCDLVYSGDRTSLAEYFSSLSEKKFLEFDWGNIPIACSGITMRYDSFPISGSGM